MSTGETINGYTVLQPFSTAGGGQCVWTFARKGGNDHFLKQFLAPVYPTPDSPGSAATKARKQRLCDEFEVHHRTLTKALRELVGPGGNLIVTRDFFRHGTKYYKVTEKVDTASVDLTHIAVSTLEQRKLLLRTIAHSLRILHRQGIVHGDLKPANILIKQTPAGVYTTKLIDFDNSYFAGKPPGEREELVGDVVYYSPEVARYVNDAPGSHAGELTVQSDIFALGVVYSQYLTGKLPIFDTSAYRYPWQAVEDGARLSLATAGVPDHLKELVGRMLSRDPAARPTIDDVYSLVRIEEPEVKPEPVRAIATSPGSSALRGSLLSRTDEHKIDAPSTISTSRLKGSLVRKRSS